MPQAGPCPGDRESTGARAGDVAADGVACPIGILGAFGPRASATWCTTWCRGADEERNPGGTNTRAPKATINQGVKAMAAKKAKGVDDAKAQRLNIRVTPDAYERLLVHAIKARVSPGELVTSLIDQHLKDWRVQANRTTRAMPELSVNLDGPVEESMSEAA